ncbi:MAG: hypothetical protein ACI9W2_001595 [Gammaproteobacteria bacterium]|jgi:hypothetical protein
MCDFSASNRNRLLSCKTLSLPQQVAVWFVRRGYGAGLDATERTARKVFGESVMPSALGALRTVLEALHRSPLDHAPVHSLRDSHLSGEEFDLLTALAVVQHDGRVEETVMQWGWPKATDIHLLDQCVTDFALHLANAKQVLPPPNFRSGVACAAVLFTEELDSREQLLLNGVRTWVKAAKNHESGLSAITALFEQQGLKAAAPALNAILTNTVAAAIRPVDVRCSPCWGGLSPDEARILHGVSASQRELQGTVVKLLSSWLQPSAIRLTAPAVEGVGLALTAAFHRLPLRSWSFPELCGRSSWFAESPEPITRLH